MFSLKIFKQTKSKKTYEGYTLMEVMLVIILITIVTAIVAPLSINVQKKNNFRAASDSTIQGLRRARFLSVGSEGDSNWGLKAQSGSIVVFKGSTYAARDTSYDETTPIPGGISFSGDTEIVFNKMSGSLASNKTLQINSSLDNMTININVKGTLDY